MCGTLGLNFSMTIIFVNFAANKSRSLNHAIFNDRLWEG